MQVDAVGAGRSGGGGMVDSLNRLAGKCLWAGLDDYAANPPLRGPQRTDLVIVGGGFTGLWTAYQALRRDPGRKVTVVERECVGYGASGRNGGFAMTLAHRSLTTLAGLVGDDEAKKTYVMLKRAVAGLTDTVAGEGMRCDAESNGVLIVSNTPPQDRRIERELETAARLGLEGDFQALDRTAAQARIHSERIRRGFFEHHCTLVNPMRLARELKRVVERMGGQVFEQVRVVDWRERRDGVTVTTDAGTIEADQAVLAVNAYGARLPALRYGVIPFYTYICVTRVLTDPEWTSIGWAGREGAEDRRDGLHYFRPTPDGRLLWGGRDAPIRASGPDERFDQDPRQHSRLRETFEWFFPQLRHVPFEFHWGGPIGMTRDFLPVVGLFDRASRRTAYAYGYNGHGVAASYLAGNAVCDLLAGGKSEWTDLYFVDRGPPYGGPIWLRNLIARLAAEAAYRADDAERRVTTPWTLKVADGVNRLLSRFSR